MYLNLYLFQFDFANQKTLLKTNVIKHFQKKPIAYWILRFWQTFRSNIFYCFWNCFGIVLFCFV